MTTMFATAELPSKVTTVGEYTTEQFSGGKIVYSDRRTHIELVSLQIYPEHQGRGLGSAVIRAIKQAGKPILLVPVALEPHRDADLMRFYARHGFVEQYPGSDWLQWKP